MRPLTGLKRLVALLAQKRRKRVRNAQKKFKRRLNNKIKKEHKDVDCGEGARKPPSDAHNRQGKHAPQHRQKPFVVRLYPPPKRVMPDAKPEVAYERQEEQEEQYADDTELELDE